MSEATKKYQDGAGRIIWIEKATLSDIYMTFYKFPFKWASGRPVRLIRKELPMCETEIEAQANLDAYASKHGWSIYNEEVSK